MERIPKSQVLRKALQEIVTGAVMEGNPMDEFFKIAMALVVQEFLVTPQRKLKKDAKEKPL